MAYEPLDSILHKAKISLRKEFRQRLYEIALINAGYDESKARTMKYGDGQPEFELPDFPTIEPARLSDGVSNPLADDSKINAQSLGRFRPEFVIKHQEPIVKEVLKAWIADEWERDNWDDKFLALDAEQPVFGYGFAHIGMVRPGKTGWKPYSALQTMWDPINRLPNDWRFIFFMDEMDVTGVLESFPDSGLTKKDVQKAGPRHRNINSEEASDSTFDLQQIRVWRYWSKDGHMAIIGNLHDPNSIKLTLNDNFEYKVVKGDIQCGPNPYKIIPCATYFEMLQPHQMNAISRAHWGEPLSTQIRMLEKAFAKKLQNGSKLGINLSYIEKELADKLSKKRDITSEDFGDVVMFEGVDDWDKVFNRLPAEPIDQPFIEAAQYLDGRRNTAMGTTDAQKGQRTPGEKTAYEVAAHLDESGLQRKHAVSRKATFCLDLVQKLRKIAGEFDTEPRKLTLSDGRVIDTGLMPLNPFLKADVRISVAESSLVYEGEMAKRQRVIDETLRLWLPMGQAGQMDITTYVNWLAGELGYTDPSSMGILNSEQVKQMKAEQQQQMAIQQLMGQQ